MKVLQIISGREINGALVYCRLLTQQLVDAGHDVTVICRRDSWILGQGLPVKIIESDMRRFPTSDLKQAAAFISGSGFDVIHTHMSRAHSFGVLLRWLTGVPVVATAHNRYMQLHWKFNDFIIANSDATRDYHRKFNLVSRDRIKTVHCFIDLKRFMSVGMRDRNYIRPEWRLTQGQFVIGVIGEVIARKGQLYLFEGLAELTRRIPNLHVVLLGRFHRDDPYVRKLRQIQIRNGLFGRVRWLGRRENIHQHMAGMDAVIVPSIEEPFGLVAVEAQAAGTPVIASATGGLPEIIQHERNGLLVPPANTRALVDSICRLAEDKDLANRLIQNGRHDAPQSFSPERLTADVIAVYERTASRKLKSAAA